jgi:hypothetical protein
MHYCIPRDRQSGRASSTFIIETDLEFREMKTNWSEEVSAHAFLNESLIESVSDSISRLMSVTRSVMIFTAHPVCECFVNACGHWSLSRIGLHCLENVVELIHCNLFGYDRIMRIVSRGEIHEGRLNVKRRNCDNIWSVVISGSSKDFVIPWDIDRERLFLWKIRLSIDFFTIFADLEEMAQLSPAIPGQNDWISLGPPIHPQISSHFSFIVWTSVVCQFLNGSHRTNEQAPFSRDKPVYPDRRGIWFSFHFPDLSNRTSTPIAS